MRRPAAKMSSDLPFLPAAIGLTALAVIDVDLWAAHWIAVDAAIVATCAWTLIRNRLDGDRGRASARPLLCAIPAGVIATLSGLSYHHHPITTVEAEFAGRLVWSTVGAFIAWLAAAGTGAPAHAPDHEIGPGRHALHPLTLPNGA